MAPGLSCIIPSAQPEQVYHAYACILFVRALGRRNSVPDCFIMTFAYPKFWRCSIFLNLGSSVVGAESLLLSSCYKTVIRLSVSRFSAPHCSQSHDELLACSSISLRYCPCIGFSFPFMSFSAGSRLLLFC